MKAFVIFGVHIEKVIFRRFLVNLLLQCTSAVLRAYRGPPAHIHIHSLYILLFVELREGSHFFLGTKRL